MIMHVDNTQAATAWLALRVIHLALLHLGFAIAQPELGRLVVALVYMALVRIVV